MEKILQQTVEVAVKLSTIILRMGLYALNRWWALGFMNHQKYVSTTSLMTNWNDITDLHPKAPVPWCIVFRIIGRSIIHQAARKIFLVIGIL